KRRQVAALQSGARSPHSKIYSKLLRRQVVKTEEAHYVVIEMTEAKFVDNVSEALIESRH
ncbi:MAG TPA: hypothetical protein VLE19_16275, partial [Pyrinomonadaceae bacterium]|nr:hypothetical protein [Pyrinomonadaceae bacterium]